MTTTGQRFTLAAADGYPLSATRWSPSTPTRAQVLVLGATGVPQGFYRAFAVHAARQGLDVLTFDYRGIGGSKPPRLRGFSASYDTWAREDAAAALAAARAPDKPLWVVGHSFGGQAMGLQVGGGQASGFYTFGSGAGWGGWMPRAERRRVWFLWNVVGPPAVFILGYLPMKPLGMGENLPMGVYRQWRRWCRYPRFFFDDPEGNDNGRLDGFGKARYPIAAANALDDLWATPASRDAFFSGYTAAPVERIDIDPKLHGGGIGHMGYFRRGQGRLWDDALAWLEKNGETVPRQDAA